MLLRALIASSLALAHGDSLIASYFSSSTCGRGGRGTDSESIAQYAQDLDMCLEDPQRPGVFQLARCINATSSSLATYADSACAGEPSVSANRSWPGCETEGRFSYAYTCAITGRGSKLVLAPSASYGAVLRTFEAGDCAVDSLEESTAYRTNACLPNIGDPIGSTYSTFSCNASMLANAIWADSTCSGTPQQVYTLPVGLCSDGQFVQCPGGEVQSPLAVSLEKAQPWRRGALRRVESRV